MTANECGVGPQGISFDSEKTVVIIPFTRNQFIYKRQIHIIVQCQQGTYQRIHRIIFIERISIQHQIDRSGIVIDSGIRLCLEGLSIAHIIRSDGHELVKDTIFQYIGKGAVGMSTTDRDIISIIGRHIHLNTLDTRTIGIIMSLK